MTKCDSFTVNEMLMSDTSDHHSNFPNAACVCERCLEQGSVAAPSENTTVSPQLLSHRAFVLSGRSKKVQVLVVEQSRKWAATFCDSLRQVTTLVIVRWQIMNEDTQTETHLRCLSRAATVIPHPLCFNYELRQERQRKTKTPQTPSGCTLILAYLPQGLSGACKCRQRGSVPFALV